MAKANTMAEVADQIVERQMNLKERAAIARQEASEVNKKIHRFGGELAIFDKLSQGETVLGVARALGISHTAFYAWIERGGAERTDALARARTRGGQSLAEQTLDIADNATPQEAQVAKLRVDTRRWLASKMSPDEFGDRQQPLVSINMGEMALDALRKRTIVLNPSEVSTDD